MARRCRSPDARSGPQRVSSQRIRPHFLCEAKQKEVIQLGGELKRVPPNFCWSDKIWKGYDVTQVFKPNGMHPCDACKKEKKVCSESAEYCYCHNPKHKVKWYYDPPKGKGYQLWENVTEGSPCSPVFRTLDELCEWAEKNATTFANFKATKEEWKKMLKEDDVHAEMVWPNGIKWLLY